MKYMKRISCLLLITLMLISVSPTGRAAVWGCQECSDILQVCPSCSTGYYCPTCDKCSACDYTTSSIPEISDTIVTLEGDVAQSYYEVRVPATMAPGGSADIVAEGAWRSTETLKVSAPDKVTLYCGDQSMDIGITFTGINQVGNDLVDSYASAKLTIASATVKFGTWTGVIEYNVELVNSAAPDHSGTRPSCPYINYDDNGDGLCDNCGWTVHEYSYGGSND